MSHRCVSHTLASDGSSATLSRRGPAEDLNIATSVTESWSTRLAFLMASIGAAVGLGNIWKFPYTLGSSGGSAFVLIYVAAIFLVATPIMMSEMILGRQGRMSAPNTMRKLAQRIGASRRWEWLGWWGLLAMFVVLSFYSVIAGWALAYIFKTASGTFTGMSAAQTAEVFDQFLHRPLEMSGWHAAFLAITVFIVARGIKGGIEKAVHVLMPTLFFTLVALVIYAAIAGDFGRGIDFLFSADFSKITPGVALAAIGQAFFSVNVGIGMVLTYSAYLPADVNLPRSAGIIAVGDTVVALLAGMAIFPIVFANGLDPATGPGLIFVTLSTAFGQMPGGAIVGSVFFLLILVAALTSSIAILEGLTLRAEELENRSRKTMAPLLGLGIFVLGLATVLSFNHWEDLHLLAFLPTFSDKTIFDLLDYLVSNLLMPIGGMMFALFAGWRLSRETTVAELAVGDGPLYKSWRFLTRIVAPLAIAAVFIFNLD